MSKAPWERKLWKQQDYPDNHTDSEFYVLLKEIQASKYNNADRQIIDQRIIRQDFLSFYHLVMNTSFVYVVFATYTTTKETLYRPVLE